jgi:arylsulfatase A-like enzyme
MRVTLCVGQADYYTFKICSPSRAAMMTGRYPWAAGFYAMNADTDHCTTNSTALPELLKPLGYHTHALGKWDVGFMEKKCSATYRGFDTFFGYYTACEADYWYHGASGGYPTTRADCISNNSELGIGVTPTDLSNNSGTNIMPAPKSLNGTYNTALLADEAARLVRAHPVADPFYMYLAFMAVHDGCSGAVFKGLGKQAPLATVKLYNTTVLDTYKVAGAM